MNYYCFTIEIASKQIVDVDKYEGYLSEEAVHKGTTNWAAHVRGNDFSDAKERAMSLVQFVYADDFVHHFI
jgi:hypothetical protein